MDEFLSDVYTVVFRQWILEKEDKNFNIYLKENNDSIIVIETNYCHSEVRFNRMNIIEFEVTNKVNNNIEFYLHFQMKTLKHAIELFNEMLETIHKLVDKPRVKILLSCTGGLTTGYFAQRLNEAVLMLSLDYEFNAVPYDDLYEVGQNYDLILLAPQIGYMKAKVQEILQDKKVIRLSSQIFAKYDVVGALQLIGDELKNNSEKKKSLDKPLSLKRAIHKNMKILSIAMIRVSQRVLLEYRIYDEDNHILLDNEIIKNRISMDDICDILDIVFVQYSDIHFIGISMPGIVNDGHLMLKKEGFDNTDVVGILSNKYNKTFILCNDVNSIAVGYYATQNNYSSFSFLFQPKNAFSGVGSIFKGQLIQGRKNIAGEVQYLPFYLEEDALSKTRTPEGTLEIVGKTAVSIIGILAPEALVFACQFITDKEELINEVEKYIPKEYIPDIIKIDNLQEYNLLGTMILCVQSLNNQKTLDNTL
ncbi:MAG: ROK family protein [Bacilli bacterium]|nr:ROK family protein [Bacilli bacterium]